MPVNVTVGVDTAAVVPAISVVVCAVPGLKVSVVGLAVTPPGSPPIATETVPLKEFTAVARTLTGGPVVPAAIVSDVGDTVSEKSGCGMESEAGCDPPPQDIRGRHKNKQAIDAMFGKSGLNRHFADGLAASVAQGRVECRESDFQF